MTQSLPGVTTETALAARGVVRRLADARAWLTVALAVVGSGLIATIERQQSSLGAADRALSGAAFGVALPFVAYLVCEGALRRDRLAASLQPLARHGANLRRAALGVTLTLAVVLGSAGALIAFATTLAARGLGDAALASDLAASLWIGALGGMTYASGFVLASTFGKRGGGRIWLLGLDFLFGLSTSILAIPWPRSHIRNLAGGLPPLEWSQTTSAAALLLISAAALGLTVERARSAS